MFPSEIMSMKACKLCILCINYLSQQARWQRGQSKMCIDQKELCFVLSDCSFNPLMSGGNKKVTHT